MTTSLPVLTLPEAGESYSDAAASRLDQAAIEALPEESALLVVQRGHTAGARYLLDAERTTAGRHPHSDIFLDDATVSRKHAEFLRRDGQFLVRDAGALNGTYVNRDRIDETVLRDGDEVWIGKYRLVFHPSHAARA
jgi:pSer/pThr/pTyr-binding forkhead associated (FHA) protein